jgi:hypothetical protein
MAIVHLAVMMSPLFGGAAGSLVDGVPGATSGFLIPMGPAVVAWSPGRSTMRYDSYGRRDRPSPRTRGIEQVRLQRRRSAMRPLRRAMAGVHRDSR